MVNSKGGVGKTTATVNIATALALAGYRIAVLDTDPQKSLVKWNKSDAAIFDIYQGKDEKDVYSLRKDLGTEYDFIIIDGAGHLSAITAACVMISDLVVIPLSPSPLDFEATGNVYTIVEAMRVSRPQLIAKILISRYRPNAKMFSVLINSMREAGHDRFKTAIKQRESYVSSMLAGETVFDTPDGQAKGEIQVLVREITDIFDELDKG